MLQFGHGGEAVETLTPAASDARSVRFNSATAVKPWRHLQRRGEFLAGDGGFNSATAVKPWRTARVMAFASQRVPTLQFGHGGEAVETMSEVAHITARTLVLQFGHGGEAVETSSTGTSQLAWTEQLQFGHGGEAVETRTRERLNIGTRWRFNSATAVKPWRRFRRDWGVWGRSQLQFGHGGEAVETSLEGGRPDTVFMRRQASIRPRR